MLRAIGKVYLNREFIEKMTRDELAAYAAVMAPFVVIEARYDQLNDRFEQYLWDMSSTYFKPITPGDMVPTYKIIFELIEGKLISRIEGER